jgi:4'-phosphopantetheinyl transferase
MESSLPLACSWSSPSEFPALSGSAAHVWCVLLDVSESMVGEAIGVLSPEERRQAERLRTDELRRRFLVRRARLRELLARYLGVAPQAICFDRGAFGKPALASPWSHSRLHFSTSHSADLGLVAVALDSVVGIDVERIRPLSDFEALVRRFFAASENDTLVSLPESERLSAFFHGWSRKEALLKAIGTGLSLGLDQVVVSLTPEDSRVLAIQGSPEAARRWCLEDLRPAPGFASALARPAGECRLECFRSP